MLRIIHKDEIKKAVQILTEGFQNYPLYNTLYSDSKRKKRFLYDFFLLFIQKNTTYVTDDLSFIICIKKPDDNPVGNPRFSRLMILLDLISHTRISELKRIREYMNLSSKMEAKYRKSEDWSIETIYKDKHTKNISDLQDALGELLSDAPLFCETHSPAHVRLYSQYGFKVVDSVDFYDITHYVLRRE